MNVVSVVIGSIEYWLCGMKSFATCHNMAPRHQHRPDQSMQSGNCFLSGALDTTYTNKRRQNSCFDTNFNVLRVDYIIAHNSYAIS